MEFFEKFGLRKANMLDENLNQLTWTFSIKKIEREPGYNSLIKTDWHLQENHSKVMLYPLIV